MGRITTGLMNNLLGGGPDLGALYRQARARTGEKGLQELEKRLYPIGVSSYRIVFIVMIFVFIIGFSIAFTKLFLFSDNRARGENKSDLIWKVVSAVCAFGAVALLILITTVAGNFFE